MHRVIECKPSIFPPSILHWTGTGGDGRRKHDDEHVIMPYHPPSIEDRVGIGGVPDGLRVLLWYQGMNRRTALLLRAISHVREAIVLVGNFLRTSNTNWTQIGHKLPYCVKREIMSLQKSMEIGQP